MKDKAIIAKQDEIIYFLMIHSIDLPFKPDEREKFTKLHNELASLRLQEKQNLLKKPTDFFTTPQLLANIVSNLRDIDPEIAAALTPEFFSELLSDQKTLDQGWNMSNAKPTEGLQEEKEVSDEDIEKWAISRCKSENESRYIALQEGAKAHRDNLIKKGE